MKSPPLRLVWLEAPSMVRFFETDWIHELLSRADIRYEEVFYSYDPQHAPERLFENACIVFNHAVDYEAYLRLYEKEEIPFCAIHLSDETLGDTCDYLSLASCRFAFRNYYHPIFSRHPKVKTFGLGFKNGFQDVTPIHHSQPWYHWCFAGVFHNPKRVEALLAFERFTPFMMLGSKVLNTGVPIEQYRRVLECSKFAICPLGQCNLDTFRFYEALECGCVPVVVGNTPEQAYADMGMGSYWHALFGLGAEEQVPWVQANTWKECADMVENLLNNPNTYFEMRKRCHEFWKRTKKEWGQVLCDAFVALSHGRAP